jgi:hypothetical protein
MVITGFNLAGADYRRSRRTALFLGAIGAGLLCLLAIQLLLWSGQRRDLETVAARLSRLEDEAMKHQTQARAVQASIPADALKLHQTRVAAYNQILEASAFSWIGLLVELERAVPPRVTLSEIHPDLMSGKVALRGEAKTFEDITKLLRGLEQRTPFRDVFLLRQTTRKPTGGGPEALEFLVHLHYQGRPR